MFYIKKYSPVDLAYNNTKNYYNTGQCKFFIDLFIINTGQCIFFLNTNTGLKKYTLTCISIKKSIR